MTEWDEKTPLDGPGQWEPIMRRFDRLDGAMTHLATGILEVREQLKEIPRIKDRLTSLELQRIWFPILFGLISIFISCYALAKVHG